MTGPVSTVGIVGGGLGGLLLAAFLNRGRPDREVTVFEQNQRSDALRIRCGAVRRDTSQF